jgi:exo-beta-1,3-glucanase (GH17 family)
MLNVISAKFQSISTYGMGVEDYNKNNAWDHSDSNCLIARAAAQINHEKNQMALRVSQGIYQHDDNNLMNKEIENAFSAAKDANSIHANTVWSLTFTNEYFTNEGTGNHILNMIKTHKNRAHQMNLKVGTRIHICGQIHGSGAMRNILADIVRESDFIMCNLYPDNNAVHGTIQNAVDAVGNAYHSYVPVFRSINPHIEVIIGETGWPSQGISSNGSPNNVANLKEYWNRMGEWAAKNKVLVQMFEAIDEPWKSSKTSKDMNAPNGPNGAEGHYGFWTRHDTPNGPQFVQK